MLNNFCKAAAEIWKLQQKNLYAVGLIGNSKIKYQNVVSLRDDFLFSFCILIFDFLVVYPAFPRLHACAHFTHDLLNAMFALL